MKRSLSAKALRNLVQVAKELPREMAAPSTDRLGKYRLLRQIGAGGMGVVVEAEDTELNRNVAVKILHGIRGQSEQVLRRFQREAQALAGLSHPNIVTVHDVGEESGQPYMVMELVDGRTLHEIFTDRKTPVRDVLNMLVQVARGVSAAHEKGIVHRDLKPGNILIGSDGVPKVVDFGLAYREEGDDTLTQTGQTLGTPLYMSPEQADGRARDIRPATDVYALGAVLYQALAGRPPHTGLTTMEICRKIVEEDPLSPNRINHEVHPDVQAICLKALEKPQSRRYSHAGEFADDLQRHLDGEPVVARPPTGFTKSVRWVRRHPTFSSVTLVAMLGLVALMVVRISLASSRASEKQQALNGFLKQGREAKGRMQSLRVGLSMLGEERERLASEIGPKAPSVEKEHLWDVESRIDSGEENWEAAASDLLAAYTSAHAVDPGNREARRELAEFYFAEFERAERRRDTGGMMRYEKLVRLYDEAAFSRRLVREGKLSLSTDPAGARAYLFRYIRGKDGRLMPFMAKAETGEMQRPGTFFEEKVTGYALGISEFNFVGKTPVSGLKLASGSYLVVLKQEGYPDTRYPVVVGRSTHHQANVRLYRKEEIGEGFVQVPAGPFLKEGESVPLREETIGDFFISRLEVTQGEYLAFLNDRSYHDVRRAWQRVPGRTATSWVLRGDRIEMRGGTERHPVTQVSYASARRYCDWLSRGTPTRFRLPSNFEWEKAARGADGRTYPWGDRFDWRFTTGGPTRPTARRAVPVGSRILDESPYGIRDMGGNVSEMCADTSDLDSDTRWSRGGSWSRVDSSHFKAAVRRGINKDLLSNGIGFRVVRSPPRE